MIDAALQDWLKTIGVVLDADQCRHLEQLQQELMRWNQRFNLTAIRTHDEIQEKHLVDSLTLLPHVAKGHELLDIGSGAGFPGLPLKIACPKLAITSVDSVGKKIRFQQHMVRTLDLEGFNPLASRIESLADQEDYQQRFDLICSRAFSDLPTFLSFAAPLLKPGGLVWAMKGADGEDECTQATGYMEEYGWRIQSSQRLWLPRSEAERTLIAFARH